MLIRCCQIKELRLTAGSKYTFNKQVDQLPNTNAWIYDKVTVTGDQIGEDGEYMSKDLDLWRRNPVECIQELIGNPNFKDCMRYAPEKQYTDKTCHTRMYGEAWTGDLWAKGQVRQLRWNLSVLRIDLTEEFSPG